MNRAKTIIAKSVDDMLASDAPDTIRPIVRGKIDMAYELGLIDYAERDHLMSNMIAACARRRDQLHRAKLARLGIAG